MKPLTITLCGSARFEKHYHAWNRALTLSGHRVFGLGSYPSLEGTKDWYTEQDKAVLDEVHKAKISASDAVLFLNFHGYLGESSLSEFEHAKLEVLLREARKVQEGFRIYFLESWGLGINTCSPNHMPHVHAWCELLGIPKNYHSPVDSARYCSRLSVWDLLPDSGTGRRERIVGALKERLSQYNEPTNEISRKDWDRFTRDLNDRERLVLQCRFKVVDREVEQGPFSDGTRKAYRPDDFMDVEAMPRKFSSPGG